ncbi:uncharacterized protein ANIA_10312 [Aspergillus nidulans FGSC A4]|uniref:Uncharacterized protein n=1 Tax=Emericella nidulans (strain FGSC A4 / ATCC 38163 / CBS 112.46 / NRRL 194 / M139) TaxID=227321 RepID=C8VP72_EMENI|nr:hypothetical protein [Aspergillus nidulans FGSC A4]CBF86888.1 TPA: hypothetical protein ANIA_10312 [Aspergillus nidulans FGSC A4]
MLALNFDVLIPQWFPVSENTSIVTCLALTYMLDMVMEYLSASGVKSSPPNVNERSFSSSPKFHHKASDIDSLEILVSGRSVDHTESQLCRRE